MGLFDFFTESEAETDSFTAGTLDRTQFGTKTKELELDQAAIDKLVADVLGGTQGLAEIFSGEQTAGIFDSTVAAQASGDLVANLVGEIAKLTAKEVETAEETTEQTTTSSADTTTTENPSLLDSFTSLFSF